MTRISILTSALLLLSQCVSAFVPVVPSSIMNSSTSLFAQKKKRRRRKNNPSSSSSSSSSAPTPVSAPAPASVAPMPITDGDELPDFDLVEDIDLMEAKQKAAAATSTTEQPTAGVAPSSVNLDTSDPDVLAAMRSTSGGGGSGGMSMSSSTTKDLLRSRNRDLENKLVVNEITEAVPSLGEYITSDNRRSIKNGGEAPGSPGGLGKKAARREARRAAAVEAELEQAGSGSEGEGFLNKLPFFKQKEGEESKSPIKLLEEGTWACIFILVGWEIYINSPLFNRAGPMAPVVFTDPSVLP